MLYPIVQYAHKIGKNTADLTTMDMVHFTKWWVSQPQSVEVLQAMKAQQQRAAKIGKELQLNRKEDNMAKHTTTSYKNAQTSRLAERGIESPINDGQEEIVMHGEEEVICSMELTKADVAALLFSISRTFEDYNMAEDHPHTISLSSLKEGLEGI